jgi:FkbM family methyltransferase
MKLLIEVGAYNGEDSLRYHSNGYRVFTFEPKRDLYTSLVERTKHLSNYTVIPKAVSLENGITKFNICKFGGASSILPFRPEEELKRTWSEARTDIHYSGESYDVETTRLDTFVEGYHLETTPIDFLHIDAQGVDLDCLKSLGKYISNVQAGVVETVKEKEKSIYIGQDENTLHNVEDFLTKHGFRITNVESNDSTQCEYNVFFKDSKFNAFLYFSFGSSFDFS